MKIKTAVISLLAFAWTIPSARAGASLSELARAPGADTVSVPAATAPTSVAAADHTGTAAPSGRYFRTAAAPVDPQATPAARELYARLRAGYGSRILSGQTHPYFAELTALAGRTPLVRAFDMQNYSPHNPWHDDWSSWDDGSVQAAIDWHKSTGGRGIVTFHWHWFSPSGGRLRESTFYTAKTGFDVSKAVTPGTREYAETLRDIDAIAAQLKRLSDAGVPVLWRPLHEAGGGWFWWGAKGPDAALKLYSLLYDRLTGRHQLHNLIWVWSTPEQDWYPGNALVDIAGYDSYPGEFNYAPQKKMFDRLYRLVNGEKMVAMTENGPIPDVEECFKTDAKWAYFLSWNDLAGKQNSPQHIRETFANPKVATLEK